MVAIGVLAEGETTQVCGIAIDVKGYGMVPISKNGCVQQDFLELVSEESHSVDAVVVGGTAGGSCDTMEHEKVVRAGCAVVRSDSEDGMLDLGEDTGLFAAVVAADGPLSSLTDDTSAVVQDSSSSVTGGIGSVASDIAGRVSVPGELLSNDSSFFTSGGTCCIVGGGPGALSLRMDLVDPLKYLDHLRQALADALQDERNVRAMLTAFWRRVGSEQKKYGHN